MQFPTDVRIREVRCEYRDLPCRTPLKFGGVVMTSVLAVRTTVVVENRAGQIASGIGEMFLSDAWGWPSALVPHEDRKPLMRAVTDYACTRFSKTHRFAHPIDLCIEVESQLLSAVPELCTGVGEFMPKLCALICLSAPDAAVHDAFGQVNGFDTYARGYGRETMRDLSTYLRQPARYGGKYIDDFLRPAFAPELPVFHLIGGMDKLTPAELGADDPRDGLPNCLLDWIRRDGLFCMKIKWRGNDLAWDFERALAIWHIAQEAWNGKAPQLTFTGDTNEMCASPDYMIELLARLRAAEPAFYDSLLYVEQPTHRDLWKHPHDFRKLAALKPVVMDESLTDIEVLEHGLALGVSGVALKTCKSQSLALLTLAYAAERNLPYTVQDLSLSGIALLQSVGLAARGHTLLGVEANGRQFFPAGNTPDLLAIHRDTLLVKNGVCSTASLRGNGLGYQLQTPPLQG